MKSFRVYWTNFLLVVLGGAVLAAFDYSLELGEFSGLVFYLYFTYFMVILMVINLVTALIFKKGNKNYRPFFVSFFCLVLFLGLFYAVISLAGTLQ